MSDVHPENDDSPIDVHAMNVTEVSVVMSMNAESSIVRTVGSEMVSGLQPLNVLIPIVWSLGKLMETREEQDSNAL